MARTPYEQGGIVGGPNMQALLASMSGGTAAGTAPAQAPPMQADTPAVPAAPNYQATGQYLGNRFKNEKSQRPWEDQSERYKIGTVLSNFDPKQGITPEALAALNAAGILPEGQQFSGGGQRLTVPNAGGRFGTGGTDDIIHGWKGGTGGEWAAWTSPEGQAQQRAINAARQGGGAPQGGQGITSLLNGGGASGNIQSVLGQYMQQSPNLAALLAQLGGG